MIKFRGSGIPSDDGKYGKRKGCAVQMTDLTQYGLSFLCISIFFSKNFCENLKKVLTNHKVII